MRNSTFSTVMTDTDSGSDNCMSDSAFEGQFCRGIASGSGDMLGVGAYVILACVAFLVIVCGAALYYACRGRGKPSRRYEEKGELRR